MSKHFNTAEGFPQSRAEVDALSNEELDAFMAVCDVEPADFDGCLACYAYGVRCDRDDLVKNDYVLAYSEATTISGADHDQPEGDSNG